MNGRPLVAVTGASGFLGAHVVVALAAAGAGIRVLAHRRPPHPLWQNLPVEFFSGSVTDPAACARFAAGTDAVIHAAGLIKAVRDPAFTEVNVQGTANLAQAVRDAVDCRLVLISSLAARTPQLSAYAASKSAGEQAAQTTLSGAPGNLVILRPPALYGPWDREGLALFKAASRRVAPVSGNGRFTLMHVQDAANAIAQVALNPAIAGRYDLAGPSQASATAREIIAAAAQSVGANPWLIPVPAPLLLAAGTFAGGWARLRGKAAIFNAGKARELLHPDGSVAEEVLPSTIFQPEINLRQGFRGTADWYKAAGWL